MYDLLGMWKDKPGALVAGSVTNISVSAAVNPSTGIPRALYTSQAAGATEFLWRAIHREVIMFRYFGPADLVFFGMVAVAAAVPIAIVLFAVLIRRRAARFGYASTRDYLQAAPRSDAEKRDAADLVLRGIVFCVLGVLFAPFVLIGLIPLFYGGRKLVYASMGLGLVDDPDQSGA